MSRLNDLLRELRSKDAALAADVEREVAALADRRAFGLNFERHVPETVELPGRRIRRGDKVRILPPRGTMPKKADERVWRVIALAGHGSEATACLEASDGETATTSSVADLVVVAEFRDPIYPGLISTGKVERGGEKPFHTVINAENFYALQALLFTHRGGVDCIYIDPPYNTGARDWKYNNDYVEGDDLYRHSKWLAFMERRLLLAKELLNPDDSVLVVTIDEKEIHHLGLLLEQVFPSTTLQLVTIVTNPKGVTRASLSRVEEYAFFCFIGAARASSISDDLLTPGADAIPDGAEVRPRWKGLLRSGTNAKREQHPTFFYPVLVDPDTRRIVGAGDSPPLELDPDPREHIDGCIAVWPVRSDGSWGRWMLKPSTLVEWARCGYVAVGNFDPKRHTWGISYLTTEPQEQITAGLLTVREIDPVTGVVDVVYAEDTSASRRPKTVWHRTTHDAGVGGTAVLSSLLPGRGFDYAKSLHAVRDTLDILTRHKKDALVVDFFAGSGTTAHATMVLNRNDGGARRTISITNNEVSADEQVRLSAEGLRPGDEDWERRGICEFITNPRLKAAVTGRTPDGAPVRGSYKLSDEVAMADGLAENVEFFTLTYEAPLRVASNREFTKVAPLLWLRAGAQGRRIEDLSLGWDVAEAYGVLADLDETEAFVSTLREAPSATTAFVVTDEDRLFEAVVQDLPEHVEPVRLYEAYLRNFEIEIGRSTL